MKHFTKMPDGILFNKEIKSTEKLILLALVERESSLFKKEGEPFYCYQGALMEGLQITKPTLISSMKRLTDMGYIKMEKINHRIFYSLNWDKIEEAGEKFRFPAISKTFQKTEEEETIETVEEPKEAPVQAECPVEPTISSQPIDCTVEEKEPVKQPEMRSIPKSEKVSDAKAPITDINRIDRVLKAIKKDVDSDDMQNRLIESMLYMEGGKVFMRSRMMAEFDLRTKGIEPPAKELGYLYSI